MSDNPHAAALLALLHSNPLLTVYDERVPETPASAYVRPYVNELARIGDDLTMGPTEAKVWVSCHCVADTAKGARIVANNVRATLLGVRLNVTGWLCWQIHHEQSIPPQRDESTGRLVMDQIDVYSLVTKQA